MKKAYGFIEMIGLASAVVAADTALKAANVQLDGLEPAKGLGMHTLKLAGEVSSVQAAVSSILGNFALHGKIQSHSIIARPSDGIKLMIDGVNDLVQKEEKIEEPKIDQSEKEVEADKAEAPEQEESEINDSTKKVNSLDNVAKENTLKAEDISEDTPQSEIESSKEMGSEVVDESFEDVKLPLEERHGEIVESQEVQETHVPQEEAKQSTKIKNKKNATCNLCGDPTCQRVKGEPRVKCIHYKEKE